MYNPDVYFAREDYILTSTGNKISRGAEITKPQSLEIPNGKVIIKTNTIIRCDLAPVSISKYSTICEDCILRPCHMGATQSTSFKFIPMTIGSHCFVGERCIVEAAAIGLGCFISNDSIISARCILKDFVYVHEGAVVPPGMVLPPFAIVAGNPARIIGDMPESTTTLVPRDAVLRYKAFKARRNPEGVEK